MSTYTIFSFNEPQYKVKADFYDVQDGFMCFYDEHDELIGSFNVDNIDFVMDEEHKNKITILEPVEENECADCDEFKCESNPHFAPKKEVPTKQNVQKKQEDNFDELFKRVLGLYGKK